MWYNKVMIWLLRSPLHGLLGQNLMLITFIGRKSGKRFSTPVNFLSIQGQQGEYLLTISQRGRKWWRNLVGGAAVTIRLHGKEYPARAVALLDEVQVADGLRVFFQKAPQSARYFNVRVDAGNNPDPQDLSRAAQERVVVQTYLAH